jgi:hypothetical protein
MTFQAGWHCANDLETGSRHVTYKQEIELGPHGKIACGNAHNKNYMKHFKWFDGKHSDSKADTCPWLFALGANLVFNCIFCIFQIYKHRGIQSKSYYQCIPMYPTYISVQLFLANIR